MKTREEIFDGLKKAIREMEERNIGLTQPSWEAILLAAAYLEGKHNWIPVEERLPEKDNEFEDYSKLVIVTNGKDFWKGMYDYGGEDWRTFDLWLIDDATHWMEIVPPRKDE